MTCFSSSVYIHTYTRVRARTQSHTHTYTRGNKLTERIQFYKCIFFFLFAVASLNTLFECPLTTELFQKNEYYFNNCNNVRDILYNTDIMNSIVKLIVDNAVGKLV